LYKDQNNIFKDHLKTQGHDKRLSKKKYDIGPASHKNNTFKDYFKSSHGARVQTLAHGEMFHDNIFQ
jgi:hypothetical protein